MSIKRLIFVYRGSISYYQQKPSCAPCVSTSNVKRMKYNLHCNIEVNLYAALIVSRSGACMVQQSTCATCSRDPVSCIKEQFSLHKNVELHKQELIYTQGPRVICVQSRCQAEKNTQFSNKYLTTVGHVKTFSPLIVSTEGSMNVHCFARGIIQDTESSKE